MQYENLMMKRSLLFPYIFKFVCFITACSMAGYWVLKYSKNEDTTLVEYKTIADSETTNLPAMSICFIPREADKSLEEKNKNRTHDHDASYFLEYIDNIPILFCTTHWRFYIMIGGNAFNILFLLFLSHIFCSSSRVRFSRSASIFVRELRRHHCLNCLGF